jgi:hypothetical protein
MEIKALERIKADSTTFELFLSDVRMSYTLLERNQLMVKRMDFLHHRNFLHKDDFLEFSRIFQELADVSNIMVGKVIYRKNGGVKPIYGSIS